MFPILLLHVTLAFPPAALSPALLKAAVTEAAAVWAPYGVAIDAATPCGCTSPTVKEGEPFRRACDARLKASRSVLLTVVVVRARQPAAAGVWSGPLGAISFAPDGAPSTAITVFLTDILRVLAETRILGAAESQWPPALRDRVVGRVVGRVIAHEIGHFLLRSTQHTTAGLMRSSQHADELGAPSGRGFTLSPAEAARLPVGPAASDNPVMTEARQ